MNFSSFFFLYLGLSQKCVFLLFAFLSILVFLLIGYKFDYSTKDILKSMAIEIDFSIFFFLGLRFQVFLRLRMKKPLPVVIKADLIAAGDHVG